MVSIGETWSIGGSAFEGQTYLAKVYFVKHYLIRMCDAPKSRHETEDSDDHEAQLVFPIVLHCLLGLLLYLSKNIFAFVDHIAVCASLAVTRPLLEGRRRTRHPGGIGFMVNRDNLQCVMQ